jgi:hypothetical protein
MADNCGRIRWVALFILVIFLGSNKCVADSIHTIVIDGDFSDWDGIKSRSDPDDNINGTVFHDGVPDCHDIDHRYLQQQNA